MSNLLIFLYLCFLRIVIHLLRFETSIGPSLVHSAPAGLGSAFYNKCEIRKYCLSTLCIYNSSLKHLMDIFLSKYFHYPVAFTFSLLLFYLYDSCFFYCQIWTLTITFNTGRMIGDGLCHCKLISFCRGTF